MTATPDWLAAWVEQRIAAHPESRPPLPGVEEPAAYLHGSIGYDTAITARGDVWLHEYDLVGPEAFRGEWHLAPVGSKDRTWILVVAARHHPELGALLPVRLADAPSCKRCLGTGYDHVHAADGTTTFRLPMTCPECDGLGWRR